MFFVGGPNICNRIPRWLLRILQSILSYCDFCATVCKTVRCMLSDRCLSCPVLSVLSVLTVTLVYCGWIKMKMKLNMQVGLGPGYIVLDGDPSSQKGQSPQLSAHVFVAKRLDGSRWHLACSRLPLRPQCARW